MEKFKEYFKFPLKMWEHLDIKVFTEDNKMAFDWLINIPRATKEKFIARINGTLTEPYKIRKTFYHKNDGIVYGRIEEGPDAGQEVKLFRMRGWGMLTGVGGYNLDAEVAAQMQDDFMNYCIEMLNNGNE
jgi:hypothetical protein